MEEVYWKQFMATGKIEDYLKFKTGSEQAERAVTSQKKTELPYMEGQRERGGLERDGNGLQGRIEKDYRTW